MREIIYIDLFQINYFPFDRFQYCCISNFDESRRQNNGPHKNCGRGGIREIRGGAEKVQNRNSLQQRRNRRVQFTQIHRRHSQIYQRVGNYSDEIFTN